MAEHSKNDADSLRLYFDDIDHNSVSDDSDKDRTIDLSNFKFFQEKKQNQQTNILNIQDQCDDNSVSNSSDEFSDRHESRKKAAQAKKIQESSMT